MVRVSPQKKVSAIGNGWWVQSAQVAAIHARSHRWSGSVMSMSKLNTRSITWNGTVTAGISSAAVRLKVDGPSTARCRRPR